MLNLLDVADTLILGALWVLVVAYCIVFFFLQIAAWLAFIVLELLIMFWPLTVIVFVLARGLG